MATDQRALLEIIQGPQAGDVIALTPGTCRLIGRHLSEGETAALDRSGQRIVHPTGVAMITDYLKGHSPAQSIPPSAIAGKKSAAKGSRKELHQDPEITDNGKFSRGADVIVGDDAISRAHAMVYFDQDLVIGVVDLGSMNGSRVNGKAITACALREGDEVALGNTVLRLQREQVP